MEKVEKLVFKVPMEKEDQKKLESMKRSLKKKGRFVEFMFLTF